MTTHETKCFEIDDRPLTVRYLPLQGIESILSEIFEYDIYHLRELRDSGYQIHHAIDIGAHMGFFGALLRHYWPLARVISIEPDIDLRDCLMLNAKGDVHCPLAIRYDGKHSFFVSPFTGGSMIYDPTVNFCDSIPETYTRRSVPILPLEVVAGNDTVDLLKMDCEGSEFDILCGITAGLRTRIRRITGEYHHIAGYKFVEKIIQMKYPHLTPRFTGKDPEDTIATFEAA